MELKNRMTRILHVDGVGVLAGDVHGQVHLFSEDLRLLGSSPAMSGAAPLCALAVADGLVVGKDRRGNLATWSLATLDLVCSVDGGAMCDGAVPANPVVGRGLGVWDGRVYTSNAAEKLAVLDLATLAVERIEPKFLSGLAVEHFCTDHPEVHAAVDRTGGLFLGSLATLQFPTVVDTRHGGMSCVRLDARHHRFQALQVNYPDHSTGIGNGVVALGLDGVIEQRTLFSRYNLDLLEPSADGGSMYSAGREGVLYVIDNSAQRPRVAKTIAGFPHETTGLAVGVAGCLYVLMLSNELVKLDAAGEYVDSYAPARRQGVWDLPADLQKPERLYCATDEGVAVIEVEYAGVGGPVLRPTAHHRTRFGMTRRLAAVPGGYVGLAHDEVVFRSDADGRLLWSSSIDDQGHGLAVSPDHERVLVACGIGGLELDAATGRRVACLSVDGLPLRVAAYGPGGERILGNREGVVCAFAADTEEELWWLDLGHVLHRMWCADGCLYVAEGAGLAEIELAECSATRIWEGPGTAACEAAVIVDGGVYVAAHDGRLLGYDYDSGVHFGEIRLLPDIPRALALLRGPDGAHYLVAGGRGGYLSVYSVGSGAGTAAGASRLVRLRETRLPRPGGRAFRLTTVNESDFGSEPCTDPLLASAL